VTYLIAIFIYLFGLTGIGIYKARQVKTQADFSVAGRTLSSWVLVCTMLACWIGTGSIVGHAGKTVHFFFTDPHFSPKKEDQS
jgi:Na+/proline symporter